MNSFSSLSGPYEKTQQVLSSSTVFFPPPVVCRKFLFQLIALALFYTLAFIPFFDPFCEAEILLQGSFALLLPSHANLCD